MSSKQKEDERKPVLQRLKLLKGCSELFVLLLKYHNIFHELNPTKLSSCHNQFHHLPIGNQQSQNDSEPDTSIPQ
jgi:hypothetical protein